MSVLLQVSDAHFGTEREPVVEALVELARGLKPDLLVVSGDITQRARAHQFDRAARFVERLAVPRVLAIPGNHDVPLFNLATRFVDPYREYRRVFGAELEPRFEADDCLVLGVKTTRRYRRVDGEVSEAQRSRVVNELREARRGQVRLVVTHQPLAVPRAAEIHNVAHGADLAVRAWAAAGADLLLAGHIHLPYVLPLHEATPLPRPVWAVNAGTAVSSRTRRDAGNSVNVIRIQLIAPDCHRTCQVEHWSFDTSVSAFACHTEHTLHVSA